MNLTETMAAAAMFEISGKTEEALGELRRVPDSGAQSAKLYTATGHLQFELGRFREAAETYERSARLDGGDTLALFNRAVCLEKLGEWEAARDAFQQVVDRDPRRTGALLGMGVA